ncbi:MAG: hypothetical protein F6K11_23705 [Leptolyngbya sp. SIO3F4]|nr:hypothetical protein [Leptolyngbya sp. SIO3F4]
MWLTFDFANNLSDTTDDITPQLFLTLMAHPAISQIKRFTANADNLDPDDIADWEPGIFTVQAYRSSLLDVLSHVSSQLAPHLISDGQSPETITITVYTQMGRRHYPVITSFSQDDIQTAADTIETMVQQHEAE